MVYSATIHWAEERNAFWHGRRKFYAINLPIILISLTLDDVTLLNVRNKLLAGFLDVMAARGSGGVLAPYWAQMLVQRIYKRP